MNFFNKNSVNIFLFLSLGIVLFFGLSYAIYSKDTIPDYDEIVYLLASNNITIFINNLYIGTGELDISTILPNNPTNNLNKYIIALLNMIFPFTVSVFILNSMYLLLLVWIINKFFDKYLVFVFIVFLSSNFYFMHLYGTFISEFSMAILIVSIMIVTLFDKENENNALLVFLLVLSLLLRGKSIVFLLGFFGILVVSYFLYKDNYLKQKIKVYAISLLGLFVFIFPILFNEFKYVKNNSFSSLKQNWQDMSGIESKLDLPLYYLNSMTYYNKFFIYIVLMIFVIFILNNYKNKIEIKNIFFISISSFMVLFALSNANSSHHLIVFWVYALLSFLLAYMLLNLIFKIKYNLVKYLIYSTGVLMMLYFGFLNYSSKINYHVNRNDIYQVSKSLAQEVINIRANASTKISTNYIGIAPLDMNGIVFQNLNKYDGITYDALGYDKTVAYYIDNLKQADVLILANRNFLWENYAKFININRNIEAIYNEIIMKKEELGFYTYKRIYYKNDPENFFEILIKPQANINLEYEHHNGDKWLGKKTGISFIPENASIKNKQLLINVEIPMVKDFNPPFIAEILNENGEHISSYTCNNHGNCEMIFDLNDKATGTIYFVTNDVFKHQKLTFEYKDWLFSPFSPKGTPDRVDNRKLTYLLKDIKLRDKSQNFLEGRLGDDWVLSDSLLKVYPKEQELVIKGMIPKEAETLLPFTFYIKSKDIDKNIIINQIGQFELLLPIVNQEQDVYIKVDKKYKLPDPDTREVSWRFLSWE